MSYLSNKTLVIGIIIGLIIGFGIGYTVTFEGVDTSDVGQQISDLQVQISTLQSQNSNFQEEITDKNEQIAYLQTFLPQEGTSVTIYNVKWEVDDGKIRVFIKNTGSKSLYIETIKIRKNVEGEQWYTYDGSFPFLYTGTEEYTGGDGVVVIDEDDWRYNDLPSGFIVYNTSYVIRITCNTGFYHEIVSSSPES